MKLPTAKCALVAKLQHLVKTGYESVKTKVSLLPSHSYHSAEYYDANHR